MPDSPIAAAVASSNNPIATTVGAPRRAITAPVKKLGPNIATMCHWMPKLESLSDRPQSFIASGADVITKFIRK